MESGPCVRQRVGVDGAIGWVRGEGGAGESGAEGVQGDGGVSVGVVAAARVEAVGAAVGAAVGVAVVQQSVQAASSECQVGVSRATTNERAPGETASAGRARETASGWWAGVRCVGGRVGAWAAGCEVRGREQE